MTFFSNFMGVSIFYYILITLIDCEKIFNKRQIKGQILKIRLKREFIVNRASL